MKTTTILSLAAAVMAAPAPQSSGTPPITPLGGITDQGVIINANNQNVWLNKPTSTYCPEGASIKCDGRTESTLFTVGGETMSLFVEVPGGQQAFVAADGELKYTQAHSVTTEPGSIRTGFAVQAGGDSRVNIIFENKGWYACPDTETYGASKLYAASRSDGEGCTAIKFYTINFASDIFRAWQYT